jgi:hypothetical protein
VSNRGLVVPVDRRRMISTAVGITLIAVGAILRFAVPATFTYGLNAHVVSVIVMLAGIFGLLLSLLVWAPLDRRRNHYGGFGRTVPPPGNGMPARPSRQRWARGSCDRESALRESEHRVAPSLITTRGRWAQTSPGPSSPQRDAESVRPRVRSARPSRSP